MLGSLLDTVMDRTIAPGYTSIGYRVRHRVAGWDDALPRLEGRTVLVTGVTSGIGRAAAERFAQLGARVLLVARDAGRGARARAELVAATGNEDLHVELCDLSSLASVRALAGRLEGTPLHVVVHNAGLLPAERRVTEDGIEVAFATNVLGPFLLTALTEQTLRASAPARVIWVSSGGMYSQRVATSDLQAEGLADDWDGTVVYARTKRAQVILAELWAERLAGSGVVVHAMHPGWVATPGVKDSLPRFEKVVRPLLRTPYEGADTIVWLGAADEPARSSGGFWHDRRARPTHLLPSTRETDEQRRALWDACVELSGAPV